MKRRLLREFNLGFLAAVLSAAVVGGPLRGADLGGGNVPAEVKPEPTAAWAEAQAEERQAVRQAIDDLRQQLNTSSQQILDQTSKDAEALSKKVQETLSARLDLIEHTMAQNQQRELEALRGSNRTFLTLAGLFAGLGVLGILIAALILARSINHFSEVALSLPGAGHALAGPPDRAALGPGDLGAGLPAQFEQANARFSEALGRLEQRIREMEGWGLPGLAPAAPGGSGNGHEPGANKEAGALRQIASALDSAAPVSGPASGPRSEASMLLGKGQVLLNLGQAEEAMVCFEQAIALEPQNAEAFVKKGLALERLQKMDQAIENYDRAIAVNHSFTLAYLYKGAVCNKLQRFQEALECYERALRSEQTTVAS
jgi:tetratricopeptide (TPR) repeat protein